MVALDVQVVAEVSLKSTSYPVAPETAVQLRVADVAVIPEVFRFDGVLQVMAVTKPEVAELPVPPLQVALTFQS